MMPRPTDHRHHRRRPGGRAVQRHSSHPTRSTLDSSEATRPDLPNPDAADADAAGHVEYFVSGDAREPEKERGGGRMEAEASVSNL